MLSTSLNSWATSAAAVARAAASRKGARVQPAAVEHAGRGQVCEDRLAYA
jgi:hypothetical protein